jgi:hypothetical protein
MTTPLINSGPPVDSIPPPQISYVDPDGNVWPLTDLSLPNGYICTAISGVAGIPVSFSSIPMESGGAIPQLYIDQPGTIGIGLYVESQGDVNAYMRLLDQIAYAFRSVRSGVPTPGQLVVQRQDGTTRQLNVFTVSGQDAETDSGVTWATFTLQLQSADPFWYDLTAQEISFIGAGSATGILPLLPIDLSTSSIFGDNIIINDGGAEAYPIWTLTGPGLPVLTNNTTGKQFGFQSALVSTQVVQVDTRPGLQSAYDINTGANMWSQIVKDTPRDLFSLAVGPNDISISMSGVTSNSEIDISWYRRWLRA